jgi:hypothetical protein
VSENNHPNINKSKGLIIMAKVITVIAPKDLLAGESFEYTLPEEPKKPRGQLAGIAVPDMTDEQLKREIINSSSVLYKAKQRGADQKTIDANQIRVDTAKAEKAKRDAEKTPATPAPASNPETAATQGEPAEDVYNADTAAEL